MAGVAYASPVDLTLLYARDFGLTTPILAAPQPIKQTLPQALSELDEEAQQSSGVLQVLASADRVGTSELEKMRGGFALPNGITVNFGFDIATSLDGLLVQRLTLPATDITTGMAQSVPVSLNANGVISSLNLPTGAGGSPVSVSTFVNQGLTNVTTMLGAGGISSLLQNQVDGQLLQQTRVLDVSVTGLSQTLAQQAAQNVLGQALSAGIALRR